MAKQISVSERELRVLEATLLNETGSVPLHERFRALFTLKALKSENAISIIAKGIKIVHYPHCPDMRLMHRIS